MKKKAQEEMFGFVMIVLIIIIIGVVFLGFSLRQRTVVEKEDAELHDLAQTVLSYTTGCEKQTVRELIVSCHDSQYKQCSNVPVCDYLNSLLSDILDKVELDHTKGISLNISDNRQLVWIGKGELKGNHYTTYVPIPARGLDINLEMSSYY